MPQGNATHFNLSNIATLFPTAVTELNQQHTASVVQRTTNVSVENQIASDNLFHGDTRSSKKDYDAWKYDFDQRALRLQWEDRLYIAQFGAALHSEDRKPSCATSTKCQVPSGASTSTQGNSTTTSAQMILVIALMLIQNWHNGYMPVPGTKVTMTKRLHGKRKAVLRSSFLVRSHVRGTRRTRYGKSSHLQCSSAVNDNGGASVPSKALKRNAADINSSDYDDLNRTAAVALKSRRLIFHANREQSPIC